MKSLNFIQSSRFFKYYVLLQLDPKPFVDTEFKRITLIELLNQMHQGSALVVSSLFNKFCQQRQEWFTINKAMLSDKEDNQDNEYLRNTLRENYQEKVKEKNLNLKSLNSI